MRFRLPALFVPCLFLFAFCADLPTAALARHNKPPKVCRNDGYVVTLDVHDTTMAQAGDTVVVNATVTHCAGVTAPNVKMTYTSRDLTIDTVRTTVSKTFTVFAVASGSAYVTAVSDGGGADSIKVTVAGCTPTATFLCPGDNCATKVSAQPTGTAFTFAAGTFRFCTISPKNDQTFTSAASHGTIFDGGRILTGWTLSGGVWSVGGQTQQNTVTTSGSCETTPVAYPQCQVPEQLWRDSVIQRPVSALANLATGTWYFDYTADKIYVFDDPTGRLIETSVTPKAIGSTALHVTVDGFTFRHYASVFNSGTLEQSGIGWTIKNNVFRDNAGACVRLENDSISLTDNVMTKCGQLGLSAALGTGTGKGFDGRRNRLDSNNTAHWNRGFSAGAMKVIGTDSVRWIGNRSERNLGNGQWWDIDNNMAIITSDTSRYNSGTGFFYEISYGCVMTNLVSENNGQDPTDALQNGAGILISASSNCEVVGSTVQNNAHGILLLQQDRGSGSQGAYLVSNANVHNNTVVATTGDIGFKGSFDITNFALNRNNHFENNHYTLQGAGNYFNILGGTVTDNAWQTTYGHDDAAGGGTITRN